MKSTLKRAIVTLAVIGLLVVVPSMCGTWTQLSKQGRRVWHDVGVGMGLIAEPAQQYTLGAVSVGIDGSVYLNGEQIHKPMSVKTQVERDMRISGTLGVYNQHSPSMSYPDAPTDSVTVWLGNAIGITITDITADYLANPSNFPDCSPPSGWVPGYIIAASIGTGYSIPPQRDVEYHYFSAGNTEPPGDLSDPTATPWNVGLDYDLWVSEKQL